MPSSRVRVVSEREIEQHARLLVERAGGRLYKFNSGVAGVPDRIMLLDGRVKFIEFKRADGKLSRIQKATIADMMRCGADCAIIRSKSQADRIIGNAIRRAELSMSDVTVRDREQEVRDTRRHGSRKDCGDSNSNQDSA